MKYTEIYTKEQLTKKFLESGCETIEEFLQKEDMGGGAMTGASIQTSGSIPKSVQPENKYKRIEIGSK